MPITVSAAVGSDTQQQQHAGSIYASTAWSRTHAALLKPANYLQLTAASEFVLGSSGGNTTTAHQLLLTQVVPACEAAVHAGTLNLAPIMLLHVPLCNGRLHLLCPAVQQSRHLGERLSAHAQVLTQLTEAESQCPSCKKCMHSISEKPSCMTGI